MHFAVIFRECTALFCSVLDAADHRHAHVGASAAAQIAQQHISAYLHAVIAGGPGRIAAVAGASLLVPHPAALQLYEAFAGEMAARFPGTRVRVQKTQITFSNRRVYACVSFLRVKRKAELPGSWFTLSLGLPYALESPRVAAKVEPYPG